MAATQCPLVLAKQKDEVDYPFMIQTIERLTGSKEFFINKAIGWLLREHSKRIPTEIRTYIYSHKDILAPLSMREGLKYCDSISETEP